MLHNFLRRLRTLCDEQTIFLLLMHRHLSCPAAPGPATADLLSGRFCRAPPSRVAPYSASLERTWDQRTALRWHFRSPQRSAAFPSESPAHPRSTVIIGPDLECKPNPSAGVSSIPLSSLQGAAAPAGAPSPVPAPPAGGAGASSGLATREYACYGSDGRLLIGLGFKVPANGTYTDLDGKSKGAFTIQSGVITFHGGHLDG